MRSSSICLNNQCQLHRTSVNKDPRITRRDPSSRIWPSTIIISLSTLPWIPQLKLTKKATLKKVQTNNISSTFQTASKEEKSWQRWRRWPLLMHTALAMMQCTTERPFDHHRTSLIQTASIPGVAFRINSNVFRRTVEIRTENSNIRDNLLTCKALWRRRCEGITLCNRRSSYNR